MSGTIEIEAPNGEIVEFPAGTPDSVITGAMRRTYGRPEGYGDTATTAPATAPASPTRPTAPAQQPEMGWGEWLKDQFTGSSRTEFPDAGEFAPALERAARERGTAGTYTTPHTNIIGRSSVTPDVNAQLDILKQIPGLETRKDKFGNVMLRAPSEGVEGWTYLNAPGLSQRDMEELATQTMLTAAPMGAVGKGATLLRRFLIAAGVMGGGEVAKDLTATAAGSEQSVDPVRAGVTAALGGVTAPGVPSAIVRGARDVIAAPFEPITNAIRGQINPQREAERRVGSALARDDAAGLSRLTDADRQLAETTGQPVATIDQGGDTTRALARAAANTSPDARGTLDRFISQRFETQAERVGDQLTSLVGGPANAHAIREAATQGQRATIGPMYEQAYRSPAAVAGIYTPGLDALEQSPSMASALARANAAMQSKRDAGTLLTRARGPTGNPTLEYWDQVARTLADDTNVARRAGRNEEARDIGSLRNRLLAEVDSAFPGYAHARGTAATFFRAGDALEAGEAFAAQHFNLDEAATAIAGMSPNERAMFQQGFASHMLERLNDVNDRRSVINQVVGSPAARRKLEIALGRNRANELEAFMHIETLMDLPRGAMGNSTTARQLVELGLVGTGAGLAGLNQNPTDPTAVLPALGALFSFASRRGAAHVDQAVMRQIATILTSQDPAVRQRALQSVAHNNHAMNALRSLDEAFTGLPRGLAIQQGANAIHGEVLPQR